MYFKVSQLATWQGKSFLPQFNTINIIILCLQSESFFVQLKSSRFSKKIQD